MPTVNTGVVVEGLRDLIVGLKALGDRDALKIIKVANSATAEVIMAKAKANASTGIERRAADTLSVVKTANYAAVRFGKGDPSAAGAEFGAKQDIPRRTSRGVVHGWNQFKEWRGNDDDAGYFLFPAVRTELPRQQQTYLDSIEAATARLLAGQNLLAGLLAA